MTTRPLALSPILVLVLAACGEPGDTDRSETITAPVVSTDPPEAARSDQSIDAVLDTPAEGPGTITYEYVWTEQSGITWPGERLPATATARGESWSVTVVPYVGDDAGPTASAGPVAITNAPPTLTAITFDPAIPTVGADLRCVPQGVDADDDPLTYTYRWAIDGTDLSETSDTLPGGNVDSGVQILCGVVANDGFADSPELTGTAQADNAPPSVDGASIVPASPASTQDARCVPGTGSDPDGDTVSFTYGWTVNGIDQGVAADTLPESAYVRDDVLVCTAYPTDGASTGVGVDSAPATVGNGAPVVASVDLSPLSPVAADTMVCTPQATDPDGDPLSYTYRWRLNGVELAETGNFLAPGAYEFQDNISCEVTASDGEDTALGTSPTAVVGNTPPSVSGVAINPSAADATTALTCTHASTSDADGHPVTVAYSWEVGGTVVGTGSTLSPGNAIKDQTVVCNAIPNDGTSDGAPISASIVLDNAPPGAPSVSVSPSVPTEADAITCLGNATDPDGDSLTYTYTWFVAGNEVASTQVLPSGSVQRGELARCEVVATDGELTGPTGSLSLTPGNQIPEITSVDVSPTTALAGDVLTCTATATDGDGDPLTTSYHWTVNGALVVTGDTLDGNGVAFTYGDSLACVATVFDGISSVSATSASVPVGNTPPSLDGVAITPAGAHTGQALTCTASGSNDADGQSVGVSYAWSVDGSSAGSGATLSAFTATRGQSATCTATPSDGVTDGTPAVASIVIANAPPSAPSVTVGPTNAHGGDELVCAASASDFDNDSLTYSYTWYLGTTALGTGDRLAPGSASRDDVVRCEAIANDGTTDGPAGSAAITLENEPPVVDSVAVSPNPAGPSATITCVVDASDGDGDNLGYSYVWLRNGSTTAATTETWSGALDVGDTLACRVTVDDGEFSATRTSSPIDIENALPTVSGVAITPTSPTTEDGLTCSHASTDDPDGDTVTVSYRWLIGGSEVGTGTTLAAGTSRGQTVTCEVTPNDGNEDGTPGTASVTIVNAPPAVASASISPTSGATENTVFTCSAGSTSDPDGDGVTVATAWLRGTTVISGETGTTLDGGSFSKGDSIACRVTPTDSQGDSGTAATSGSVSVGNSPPTGGSVSVAPAAAFEGDILTCSPSGATDPDGDPVSWTYQWRRGSSNISGATSATLSDAGANNNFARGDSITCRATPQDNDGGVGSAVTSSAVVIGNSPPTVTDVSVSPASPKEGDTLTCSASGSDPDGDGVSFTYQWRRNGSNITGATSATLTDPANGSNFAKGDTVTCRATPSDGDLSGTTSSASRTIGNTVPTVDSVDLDTYSLNDGDTVTCSASGSDVDGDNVSISYEWLRNGTAISGQTDASLTDPGSGTNSLFATGDVIRCRPTPNDGDGDGPSSLSSGAIVYNTAPTASASMTPSTLRTLNNATCSATTGDLDGDDVTISWRWRVNGGQDISGQTSTTLDESFFVKGDSVQCRATPNDGTTNGTTATRTKTVANTKPSMGTVRILGSRGQLSCGGLGSDPDEVDGIDTLSYTYQWEQSSNNSTWNQWPSTSQTINVFGSGWYRCTIRVGDGTASTSRTSASYFYDGGIIEPFRSSKATQVSGRELRRVHSFGFDPSLDPACEVIVDIVDTDPELGGDKRAWSASTYRREVELLGAFELDADGLYEVRVETAGCEDEVFEVAIDGEWRELRSRGASELR